MKVKFPENLEYKHLLKRGDYSILAKKSKYSARTIGDIINGHRKMTDRLKKAITSLLIDRNSIDTALNEAAGFVPKCCKDPEE